MFVPAVAANEFAKNTILLFVFKNSRCKIQSAVENCVKFCFKKDIVCSIAIGIVYNRGLHKAKESVPNSLNMI